MDLYNVKYHIILLSERIVGDLFHSIDDVCSMRKPYNVHSTILYSRRSWQACGLAA